MTDSVKKEGQVELQTAYVWDEDGYLESAVTVQESPLEKGCFLMPPNSTLVAPALDPAYFAKWNESKQDWEYEKIPTEPQEFEGMVISHTKKTRRCEILRNRIRTVVESSSTHKIRRGPENEWMCEKLHVKTEEELLEEVKSSVRQKRDYLLSQTDYLLAADYPISEEDRDVVKAYRQALRDVPQQPGFPNDVEWPESPDVVK